MCNVSLLIEQQFVPDKSLQMKIVKLNGLNPSCIHHSYTRMLYEQLRYHQYSSLMVSLWLHKKKLFHPTTRILEYVQSNCARNVDARKQEKKFEFHCFYPYVKCNSIFYLFFFLRFSWFSLCLWQWLGSVCMRTEKTTRGICVTLFLFVRNLMPIY